MLLLDLIGEKFAAAEFGRVSVTANHAGASRQNWAKLSKIWLFVPTEYRLAYNFAKVRHFVPKKYQR